LIVVEYQQCEQRYRRRVVIDAENQPAVFEELGRDATGVERWERLDLCADERAKVLRIILVRICLDKHCDVGVIK
jgi:hypothetical protein